jgi:protein-S-isoprenylcysteine O-methyltransferase Ste14
MIFAGGVLHLAVVALPLVLLGGRAWDGATLVFLAGASALYLGDATTMRWTHEPSRSPLDARSHRWATATGGILLLLFWVCLVEHAIVQPAASWVQLAGALLLSSGAALRASAVHALGRCFRTEIADVDGALVRAGIYRYLRHPSETGLLAAALGAAVVLRSTLGVALWCGALLPLTLVRLSLEERALVRRFGEDYRRYAKSVGGLLPFGGRLPL